ncbi:unnamed protein product [Prunus armeniaca]|uniref:DUF3730 domain-containing protein n=1 Tax=Prunus armeniaca TaxID=36596 RepID=A0A6J5UH50_PRUAR|nr:unnamed protein product [Prunus armeniaca]
MAASIQDVCRKNPDRSVDLILSVSSCIENKDPVIQALGFQSLCEADLIAIRLLCQTWETNDRAFGSLQGVLLPKGFTELKSERNICISMAASIRDVCRKNPDRGVDLILSVSSCIENKDPVIQALGFQSLAHLCEADVIGNPVVY